MQKQKNRIEVQGNNLHFPLFRTKQNANYSPEPRLCSFVSTQFETRLFLVVHEDVRGEIENNAYANFWGINKVHYGI